MTATNGKLHVLIVGALSRQHESIRRRLKGVRLRFMSTDDFTRSVPRGLHAVILNTKFMSHKMQYTIKRNLPDHMTVVTVHGGIIAITRAVEGLKGGTACVS